MLIFVVNTNENISEVVVSKRKTNQPLFSFKFTKRDFNRRDKGLTVARTCGFLMYTYIGLKNITYCIL